MMTANQVLLSLLHCHSSAVLFFPWICCQLPTHWQNHCWLHQTWNSIWGTLRMFYLQSTSVFQKWFICLIYSWLELCFQYDCNYAKLILNYGTTYVSAWPNKSKCNKREFWAVHELLHACLNVFLLFLKWTQSR